MKFIRDDFSEIDAWFDVLDHKSIRATGDFFELPSRATEGSAGYDFHSPFDVIVRKGKTVRFPLCVKVEDMPKDTVLLVFNRSGLSLKNGIRLDNAVGVIDSDYKETIWFQATNHGKKTYTIHTNDRVAQGVFVKFGKTDDDTTGKDERHGGFGSTGK